MKKSKTTLENNGNDACKQDQLIAEENVAYAKCYNTVGTTEWDHIIAFQARQNMSVNTFKMTNLYAFLVTKICTQAIDGDVQLT